MPDDSNHSALVAAGLIAGLVQVTAGVAMYLAGVYFAPWSMAVSLAVLLVCIVTGTRWYRAHHASGRITYAQALGAGVVISLGTGIVYAIYNVISISFLYPNFLAEMARARGEAGSTTAMAIAIGNLLRLTVFGSILSVPSAFFLKSPPPA